ncbi:unnamed protein product [Leptosia nina]|uniref:CRAL-TRIO domain-containing protein n=1 Tax=Leptosia nina TaxID=320188 RepID=A0AAV1IX44_9NEOP
MNYIPKKQVLFYSDAASQSARERINLGKTKDMDKVVEMLRTWLDKQPHIVMKNFSRNYLEMCILGAKGSTERAKTLLDRICTFRTLMPKYFEPVNVSEDFKELFEIVTPVTLPKYSKDLYRVIVMKFWGDVKNSSQISHLHRNSLLMIEHMMQTDSVSGCHICVDLSETNILEIVTKQNPFELKDVATITMEAYGMQVKGIHLISTSKLINSFISLIKQVLKPKMVSRIHVYKSWTELHDILGKDVLPEEFGGNEKSIKDIHADWLNELSSEEFINYLRERTKACTDESRRPELKFNEEYAGTPGSFRVLSLD